jgi:hypothetical protein
MASRANSDPLFTLLVAVTLALAGGVAFIGYLTLRSTLPPGGAARTETCDVTRPDDEVCDRGEWCIRGTCQARPPVVYARAGESCRERMCEPPNLECNAADRTCYPGGSVLPTPPNCEDPRVRDAVERLAAKCQRRTHDIHSLGEDPMNCSGDVWKDLTASDTEIDLLLSAFPDRFAVSFPRGQPQLRGRWPDAAAEAYLLAQLRPFRARLAAAHKIFVIGRASPDGSADKNYALTLRRIDVFQRLVTGVLRDGLLPSQAAPQPRYVSWGVAGEDMLTLENFARHYVGTLPPFGFDAGETAALRDGLARLGRGETIGGKERVALEQAANRVVLVIPILCDPRELERLR